MEKKKIAEWAESPVTIELLEMVAENLANIREAKQHVYHPGEPQKTQETVLSLIASEGAWEDIQLLLKGDWEFYEQDEEEDARNQTPA